MKKLVVVLAGLAILAGCSSQGPSQSSEQKTQSAAPAAPPAPELLNGRVAFQKLYVAAHGWAGDAKPYRLESQPNKESNGHDGKSGVWRGFFASAMRRGIKPYIWSGIKADDAPDLGVSPGTEDTYNPSNTTTQVFDIGFLKIDSDKAFEAAQKHGGEKILAKNADLPVFYVLDWQPRSNELIWHVIYGADMESAKLKISVDASTGDFLRVEK